MRCRWIIAGFCFSLCLAVSAAALSAQNSNSQDSSQSSSQPDKDQKDKDQKSTQGQKSQQDPKNTRDQKNKPSQSSATPQPAKSDAPAGSASPSQPASKDAQTPADDRRHSTAEDNPFPEAISKKAADATAPDAPAATPDPPGDSSSLTGLDKADVEGTNEKEKEGRRQLKLTGPVAGQQPYDPKLAENDDRIGDYYMKAGNWAGAYARFKEACAANPEDARAVFGLAEAARKLDRAKEAAENYQVYLDAFPDGPKAKAARKALSELKVPATQP
jgi:tetratricopeptide (TPR) repeat protein